MNLSDFLLTLPFKPQADEQWAVLGPEAGRFQAKLAPAGTTETLTPELDGVLLAGALSAKADGPEWLTEITSQVKEGAAVVVIDWQVDGPLDRGPEWEQRVKRGQLCRLLRQSGFGQVEVVTNHTHYYIVRAIKSPALAATPYAGQFIKVAELKELPRNTMKPVTLLGHKIIVANTGKEIVAFAQTCPHADAPLDRGLLRGRNVVCRSHGYIWNVCTGEPVEPADEDILVRYPVRIDSNEVLVAVTPLLS